MIYTQYETDIKGAIEALRIETGANWLVPDALAERAALFFRMRAAGLREYCEKLRKDGADITPETEAVLLEDYARALFGVYKFKATREQMQALRPTKSPQTFIIDAYALYYIVLCGYARTLDALADYERNVKSLFADETTRRGYIQGPYYTAEARAASWMISAGLFTAADFTDIAKPSEISGYIDRCETVGAIYDYTAYYLIARYCLNATPQELERIPAPREDFKNGEATALEFAQQTADFVREVLTRQGLNLAEVVTAQSFEEIQNAREKIKQDELTVSGRTGEIIRIPENYALLLSRDIYYSREGKQKIITRDKIAPLKAFIDNYLRKHPEFSTVSPYMVEKTLEGLYLYNRLYTAKPINGLYTFETNISVFAAACGFKDANDDEKQQILTALQVLDGLYLVVWRPKGPAALRFLSVRMIGLKGENKGRLILDMSPESMQGRPKFIAAEDYKRLSKTGKGQAAAHFRYQILTKGHKLEETLLNEVFGYDTLIAEYQENGADELALRDARRNIDKHKPRDRKRLLKYFEDCQKEGLIKYTRTENARGEVVYSWETAKGLISEGMEEPKPDILQPDEQ